jgi:hypothetical protein
MKAVLAVFGLLAGLSGQMFATSLAPGGSVTPASTSLASDTLLDGPEVSSWQLASGAANGKVYFADYTDSVTGDLDFVFEVTSCGGASGTSAHKNTCGASGSTASTVNIASVTLTDYTGATTDVYYETGGGGTMNTNGPNGLTNPAGTDVPTNTTRSAGPAGAAVTYNFGTTIGTGVSSALLIIETNATSDNIGAVKVTGVTLSNGTAAVFDPLAPTPEPGFYGLMAFGIVALLFSAKRFSRKRADLTA